MLFVLSTSAERLVIFLNLANMELLQGDASNIDTDYRIADAPVDESPSVLTTLIERAVAFHQLEATATPSLQSFPKSISQSADSPHAIHVASPTPIDC